MSFSKAEVRLADKTDIAPRTGVFTVRNFARQVSRCPGYEFEDVIAGEIEPGAVMIHKMVMDTSLPFRVGISIGISLLAL